MEKKVVKNAGWIIGCKIIKAVLTLMVTALTTRYLGVSNYGLINYAAGLVAFVSPLSKLSLDSIIVFDIINGDNEGETLGTSILLAMLSSVFCILGIVSFSAVASHGEPETVLVCGLYSIMLLFQALELIRFWFQAKLLSKYSALAILFAYVVVTVFQTLLILSRASIYLFALSHSVDYAVIAGILYYSYRKRGGRKLSFSVKKARDLVRISRYYIVSGIMVSVFNNTDKIMLKLMVGNEAAGIYSAATVCAGMTSFIFVAMIESMRPVIFESKKNDTLLFEKNIVGLYSVILYCSLFQSLFICFFSGFIIRIVCGAGYVRSVSVLRLAVWYTTFSYLGIVRNIWILSEGMQRYLWIINLSGALMNVVLNSLLIPRYAAVGAAVASVISQFFTNVVVGCLIPDIRHNNTLMLRGADPRVLSLQVRGFFSVLPDRVRHDRETNSEGNSG